jgi:3-deoxy-manno-octulosonate cytidylyltransferase (CMP-KDO synthetase)
VQAVAENSPGRRHIVVGIPARYHSTRFPGKALAELAGRPVIEHVYRQAAAVPGVAQVLIATDDERIAAAAGAFGGEAVLTRADHASGTDRLAEVFAARECDLVVNLQGDEPLIRPDAIAAAIEPLSLDATLEVSTLKTRIRDQETLRSPHAVKVVTDAAGDAVGFSRRPVPPVAPGAEVDLEQTAYFKHIGLYVYTQSFLLRFAAMPPTPSEKREQLEQLRMLDNGIRVRVVETRHDSIGIDMPEDLARAEALLSSSPEDQD